MVAPGKILIVDDIDDNRHILRAILEREGWDVIEANDGCHVTRVAAEEHPDLIMMDYNMPFTNGIQACREVKDDLRVAHIPVLLYTGMSNLDVRSEALKAGAVDFLQKPLRPVQLRDAIAKAYLTKISQSYVAL